MSDWQETGRTVVARKRLKIKAAGRQCAHASFSLSHLPVVDQDFHLLLLGTWNPRALLPNHHPLQYLDLIVFVFPRGPAVSFLSLLS